MKNILVTGGAGFEGTYLVERLLERHDDYMVIVVDGDPIKDFGDKSDRVRQHTNCITDERMMSKLFELYEFFGVFHLAEMTHTSDIDELSEVVRINIMGSILLANLCTKHECRLLHSSTNEVYGSLESDKKTHTYETNCYRPTTPYAATKASVDLLLKSYHKTHGTDIVIVNSSTNYGPRQDEDKFMPKIINAVLNDKSVDVYGTGENIRDWIYVKDHAESLDLAFHRGSGGQNYNVGGGMVKNLNNKELVEKVSRAYRSVMGIDDRSVVKLINYTSDIVGHDFRHSVNYDKSTLRLRWKPNTTLEDGIDQTIRYYAKGK
jgi:dTDP-glucose 4,6-dehydratase